MFENYSLEEKKDAFEKALSTMNLRQEFADKLKDIVMEIADRLGDLRPINIARSLAHNTLLSQYQAQELADRFFEILTEGKHKTSFERMFPNKLKESDINRIVKKLLHSNR
jgi:predicted Zn-dependent protease with MMP-like domain